MERHTRGGSTSAAGRVPAKLTWTDDEPRTGMPPLKPYVYDRDGGAMPEAEVQARIAAARAMLRGEDQPEPQAAGEPPRCGECGYLLARCACPGGLRGGAR